MMRQVADDGSNGASVWWWPGGAAPLDGTDFGIIDPDGTPRACARTLAQWNASFAAAPPDLTSDPPATVTVDRDADARGSFGLFLNNQDRYVQSRQARQSVILTDQGTGADTSTMPLVQVGNVPYDGSGPLKFADAEFAGIHVVCPSLDVTVENGSTLTIPAGATCQATPTLVNTGQAQWLPGSAPGRGVILHTNAGDLALAASLAPLQRTAMGPLTFTMGQSGLVLTGRLKILGAGDFGEVLNLMLEVDSTVTGSCPISLSPAAAISARCLGRYRNHQDHHLGRMRLDGVGGPALDDVRLSRRLGQRHAHIYHCGQLRSQAAGDAPHRQLCVHGDRGWRLQIRPRRRLRHCPRTSLNFDKQNVGATGPAQSIQLTNTGTAVLTLLAITAGGLNSGDFAETNDCGTTLAAGQRCTVQVTFTPTAPGMRTASLFIAGNIGAGTSAIDLSGIGIASGPTPTIQAIVDSWGYTAGIAPGLWVTIGGTNLAGPPQTWNLDGVQELPVALGGVTVTFNGAPAALLYVSPTQINALIPASVVPGKVQVVVQVNGLASNPFTITAQAAQPAVYAPPNADASTFFVTAALAGTATLVGNRATDPRVVRPVYPGDALDLVHDRRWLYARSIEIHYGPGILWRVSGEHTGYGNRGRGNGQRRIRRADGAGTLSGADRGAGGSGGGGPSLTSLGRRRTNKALAGASNGNRSARLMSDRISAGTRADAGQLVSGAGKRGLHLLHGLVDGEAGRLLAWWKLLERLQKGHHDRICG